jgi:hypothetical protein
MAPRLKAARLSLLIRKEEVLVVVLVVVVAEALPLLPAEPWAAAKAATGVDVLAEPPMLMVLVLLMAPPMLVSVLLLVVTVVTVVLPSGWQAAGVGGEVAGWVCCRLALWRA